MFAERGVQEIEVNATADKSRMGECFRPSFDGSRGHAVCVRSGCGSPKHLLDLTGGCAAGSQKSKVRSQKYGRHGVIVHEALSELLTFDF
jgi:hypothetical protein